jgi:NTP pyrophosphatase (non-canonical NTP hydrolase)
MIARAYQESSARTLIPEPDHAISGHDMMLVWCATGLIGEAGEVADYIKKGVFHQHDISPEKLKDELGDVMWYIASLCTLAGIDLGDVMEENVKKLEARYPNGYNSFDSIHRR